MQSKTVGWVLLVVGVVGVLGAWSYDYGTIWMVVMTIVALIGAWMVWFRDSDSSQAPPPAAPM